MWWFVLVVFVVLLIAARVAFVRAGWLYGADRIAAVDVAVSAAMVVAIAFTYRQAVRTRPRSPSPAAGGSLTDWLGVAAAVLGLPVLVIAAANVVAPATPNGLSPAACDGAPPYGWPYYGVTTGPIGNYARNGPGLSFQQTDRFDSNCTIGFVGYCLGDPVVEPITKWVDTRWLLVGRHTRGIGKPVAGRLSAEPGERRFLTHAYVAPKSPDSDLRYLGDECDDGRPPPGRVTLSAEVLPDGRVAFKVRVDNAERVGVAIALPRAALRSGSAVRRVYAAETDASGGATITWNAPVTERQLVPQRTEPVEVGVLAIACLGPVAPADPESAGTLAFEIRPDGSAGPGAARPLDHRLTDSMRRAACDSEPQPGAVSSPSASASPTP
ncbi:hypothetical protein [Dactylosporangium sp. CS-033363]|uniref:hypothetical protein n=1 Tax=Dactylosporangium sp. CS-033363 TaxID=3239935 RepID=UPI003D8EFFAA